MTALFSPDKQIEIQLKFKKNGSVLYSILKNGSIIIPESALGLVSTIADFTKDLELLKINEETHIDEYYEIPSGKRKICHNLCNEQKVDFIKKRVVFSVVLRAYNDGAAFKYEIHSEDNFEIISEKTGIVFDGNDDVWCNHDYEEWYEFLYKKYKAKELNNTEQSKYIQMPFLVRSNGTYIQISESNLNGSYCGISYVSENSDNKTVFTSVFAKTQNENVKAEKNFISPWRTFIIGDEKTVAESTMIIDLADKCDEKADYSFVKPGVSAWSWLDNERKKGQSGSEAQHDTEKIKSFIDLAADMGWSYFIMDEGWQPKVENGYERYQGYFDEFEEWKKYADSKNIGLFVWCDSSDLNTMEKRLRLKDWADKGIKGIKVDFFNEENQKTLKLYNDITEECKKLRLMVIAHGINKSTGEEKTYPNILAKEGIHGQEQGSVTQESAIRSVFTRFAVGNTDFTEYLVPRENNVTAGFQLGMSIVYTNGVHCFADGVSNYRNTPAAELLKNFPPYFEEMNFISGNPDEFVIIARKFKDTWYVGGISNIKTQQTVALSFLSKGDYNAVIYTDSNNYLKLHRDEKPVSEKNAVKITMNENGGFLMKITKCM